MLKIRADRLYLRPRADLERTIMRYFLVGLRQSGRAFLIEAEKHVPVVTGMALGSLKPLARIVRYDLQIFGSPHEAIFHGQRIIKDENLGENQGSAYIYKLNNSTAVLRVETNVYHYQLRDLQEISTDSGFSAPTPWESFALGSEAAKQELEDFLNFKLQGLAVFGVKGQIRETLTEAPVNIIG